MKRTFLALAITSTLAIPVALVAQSAFAQITIGPGGVQIAPPYDNRPDYRREHDRHPHSHLGNLPHFYVIDGGRAIEVFQRQDGRRTYYEFRSGRDVRGQAVYSRGREVN